MSSRGVLLVLEGAEGVGKSTQLRLLAGRLAHAGVAHTVVREPGGTPLGDAVRNLVLNTRWSIDARAEALLFMASRAQLVRDIIHPALIAGHVVVTDRFFLSTYAYQIVGRGLPEAEVRSANALATGGLVPDLTLLLDLAEGVGLRRAASRGAQDRIEDTGADFHRRVGVAFAEFLTEQWQSGHPECGPIVRVDASGTPEQVASRIHELLTTRLPHAFGGLAGAPA